MLRAFVHSLGQLFTATAAAVDSDAVNSAADLIGASIARERERFSLSAFISAQGVRPSIARSAARIVFARTLRRAWEDGVLSEREQRELDAISRSLELVAAEIALAHELAMNNAMRALDGLPPLDMSISASASALMTVAARAAKAGSGAVSNLGSNANKAFERYLATHRERRTHARSAGECLAQPSPSTASPDPLAPFDWTPPASNEDYASILESMFGERPTSAQIWLAKSLGGSCDDMSLAKASGVIQRLMNRASVKERVATLRRQCAAVGAPNDSGRIAELWDALCERLPDVEFPGQLNLFELHAAGVRAPRAFSVREGWDIEEQVENSRASCDCCRKQFDRAFVMCEHCSDGSAWRDPFVPRLGAAHERLGVAWCTA